MKEEFVSYKNASALKEIGFNEPCFALYDEDKQFKYIERAPNVFWCKNKYISSNRKFFNLFSKKQFNICSAPTNSQVFRWARDNFDIEGNPNTFYHENGNKSYRYSIYGKSFKSVYSKNEFKSFEEAEQECLEQLIEVVRTK